MRMWRERRRRRRRSLGCSFGRCRSLGRLECCLGCDGRKGGKEGVSEESMKEEWDGGMESEGERRDGPGMGSVLGHGASRERMQGREIMSVEVNT